MQREQRYEKFMQGGWGPLSFLPKPVYASVIVNV